MILMSSSGLAAEIFEVVVDLLPHIVQAGVVLEVDLGEAGDPGPDPLPGLVVRDLLRSSVKMLGRSGRGPTMFMSPLSTLKSCGSSSSRYCRASGPP